MIIVRNSFRWLLILAAAALLCAVVIAQENRATIVGSVTDPQDGMIPNDMVKATNIETNTTTNDCEIVSLKMGEALSRSYAAPR